MRIIDTAEQLDALPAGSVIVDLGANASLASAPVVACKAADGGWQVLGGPLDLRWNGSEVARDAEGSVLVVAYDAFDGLRQAVNDNPS